MKVNNAHNNTYSHTTYNNNSSPFHLNIKPTTFLINSHLPTSIHKVLGASSSRIAVWWLATSMSIRTTQQHIIIHLLTPGQVSTGALAKTFYQNFEGVLLAIRLSQRCLTPYRLPHRHRCTGSCQSFTNRIKYEILIIYQYIFKISIYSHIDV